METLGGYKKQTIFIICSVVLISLFVVGLSYSNMSNIGSDTTNVVVTNYPVTATFKESNIINEELPVLSLEEGLNKNGRVFSVLNESEESISYDVYIKVLEGNVLSASNIIVSFDNEEGKVLSSYTSKDNSYLISSSVLKHKNDASDVATHNLRVWAKSGSDTTVNLEVVIVGDVATNVLAERISLMSKTKTNELFVDPFGAVRYYGENPNNYVLYNDELWRIIGVFDLKDNNKRDESRVKIVRNESIGNAPYVLSNNYTWGSNIGTILYDYQFNNTNQYLTSYLKESSSKLINIAPFNFGSLTYNNNLSATDLYDNEISKIDTFGRRINDVLDMGILSASDYYFASKDKTTGNYLNTASDYWLINYDAESTNYAYCIDTEGNIQRDGTTNSHGIRPVVYLKPTIAIVSGDGSLDNPYVIK